MISPYRSTYVSVRGGPVHVADFGGSGPPVVMVHGLGGSHVNWVSVGGHLTALGHVTAPDLPGFGLSPARKQASIDDHRRTLAAYLETLGGPALLVANSMGALISMRHAARAGAGVSGLVLVSPAAPIAPGAWPDAEITSMFSIYLVPMLARGVLAARRNRMTAQQVAAWTLDLCSAQAARIPPDVFDLHVEIALRRLHLDGVDEAMTRTAQSMLRTLARRSAYDRDLASISAPTMVVSGRQDRLVRHQAVQRLAGIRPDWDIHLLDDVGHVAMLEVPITFAGLVTEWARRRAAA